MVLPVIFHNLQGYDAHLFVKQPAKLKGGFSCIPSTEEKHISFSKKIKVGEYKSRKTGDQVHSIFKFVSSTLLRFFKHLLLILFQIFISRGEFGGCNPSHKGVYPYDYDSSISKFSETQLPPKSEFYLKLNDEDISDSDYQHALDVWNAFNCKPIRDYHNRGLFCMSMRDRWTSDVHGGSPQGLPSSKWRVSKPSSRLFFSLVLANVLVI